MEGAGLNLPMSGTAFLSVNNADKGQAVVLARRLKKLGFDLIATYGTTQRLKEVGLEAASVFKVNEGRPNIVDFIKQRQDFPDYQHASGQNFALRTKFTQLI